MMEWQEAMELLTHSIGSVGMEQIPLEACYGRVLAEDIVAGENIPGFDRSPYDGYAFRASDSAGASKEAPVTLSVIEEIRAGQTPGKKVESGTAVRLMTGAPIPEGADAVCKYEDTVFTKEQVTLSRSYHPGENIVKAGEDICPGTEVMQKGYRIDAGMVGTLASLGITEVPVYRRPVAGILSTGDEVVEPGEPLPCGKIRNSNRYMIAAAMERIGYDTVSLGHSPDTIADLKEHILRGEEACDLLVSTGGVSAGDYDLVPDAMLECGYEIPVKGVGMKPGMACAYGVKKDRVMLGLSGNPASSLTNLQCICYPALRKLAGYGEYGHMVYTAKLGTTIVKTGGHGTRFVRGRMVVRNGELLFEAPTAQGNQVISSAIRCDAYGILNGVTGPLESGSLIEVFMI